MTNRADVLIVGGGPVGLFGAALASLHGMRVKIVEALPRLGGQLTAVYPEKKIYDVAGFRGVRAQDFAETLIAQALDYEPEIVTNEMVERVEQEDEDTFSVVTNRGRHLTRTVLLTVGIGSFSPRPIPAAGADRFLDRGVYYFMPFLDRFRGRRVAVVGGGDSAVDWAIALSQVAGRVYLIHRRKEFRAQSHSVQQLHRLANVEVMVPVEVRRIEGDEWIRQLSIEWTEYERHETLSIDALVSGLGFVPKLGPLKSWPLEWDGVRIRVQPNTMETSIPRIFAAGDVVSYPGKVFLIVAGFGEIGIAVARIRQVLNPKLSSHLPHSSNMDLTKPPVLW